MWTGGKRALKPLLLRWWCAVWWSALTFYCCFLFGLTSMIELIEFSRV